MKPRDFLILVLYLAAVPALAHDNSPPWYGGQVAASGEMHVEFAVRDGGVRAWVRDHADRPVAATGKATLLVGASRAEVALRPDGDHLTGAAAVTSADKVVAVVTLEVAGGTLSARFAQNALVVPAVDGAAKAGQGVFQAVCATCHGASLRGTDQGPPLLHPWYAAGAGHDDAQVLKVIGNGTVGHMWKFGDMPKPDGVQPGQDVAVLAYVRAMQAANGFGPAPAAAPVPAMPGHQGHMGH